MATTMTVHCPSCDTAFPVDPAKVPEGGVRTQCTSCRSMFRVDSPEDDVWASSAPMAAGPGQVAAAEAAVGPFSGEEPVAEEPPLATEEPVVEEPPPATEEPAMEEPPLATEELVVEEPPLAAEEPAVEEPPLATEEPAVEEPEVDGSGVAEMEEAVAEFEAALASEGDEAPAGDEHDLDFGGLETPDFSIDEIPDGSEAEPLTAMEAGEPEDGALEAEGPTDAAAEPWDSGFGDDWVLETEEPGLSGREGMEPLESLDTEPQPGSESDPGTPGSVLGEEAPDTPDTGTMLPDFGSVGEITFTETDLAEPLGETGETGAQGPDAEEPDAVELAEEGGADSLDTVESDVVSLHGKAGEFSQAEPDEETVPDFGGVWGGETTAGTAEAEVDEAPAEAPVEPPPLAGGFQFGKRDPHEKARRLARVLVSDMITYNPERHASALRNSTLKEDFEDEIEKSWKEYVEQVGTELAESTSYWTDALNDILAQGEPLF
ncbi:MAG: zinc-ribbon domain-containing protein [Gemmatimonadales bacterium]|nr:MAG: zinc-ribbon domain-containing protein [Gemmatimonadales bacterium]